MAYLLLALTTLFWAGNIVLARMIHLDIPPVTLATLRWGLAWLIISPFFIPKFVNNWRLICHHYKILLALSIIGVASFNTLIYIGLTVTTATNATLLQSAIPIVILILSATVLKDKVSKRQWCGVAISSLGVLMLITKGDLSNIMALQINDGDLWVLAAVFSWAVYSILLRWRPQDIDGFSLFGITVTVAVLFLLPISLIELTDAPAINWSLASIGTIIYMAIFPSILAYIFWNKGIAELGAAKAGLFIHLMPLYGIILAATFLDETIESFHLVGILLIFCGIYFAVITKGSLGKFLFSRLK
jgi:drug/metabolite transporter (DMT)-like permease